MTDPKISSGEKRTFEKGEEDGYRTDTFSRGDREGLPPEEELKATDDTDSRKAPPQKPDQGGVR